jgi:nucleotide-binding universal stress UspA family protein
MTGQYERLLVPVDGSDASMTAVEEAVALAGRLGASIHALYVVDPGAYHGFTTEDRALDALEREGDAALADVEERCHSHGVPVETALERGHPGEVIVEYAADEGLDCIVMATHGRRGLDRYLLGSVTERVVRHADRPVLTVRAPTSGDQ